jgi:hypothetical protein
MIWPGGFGRLFVGPLPTQGLWSGLEGAEGMSAPVDRLLGRLEGVRKTGPLRWMARCPAHEDRTASLSIRETDEGKILIYDFAGCGACDVLAAVGLDLADLFPERVDKYPQTGRAPRHRSAPPISAGDALELLDQEAWVVEIAAHDLAQGVWTDQHRHDLGLAASRISAIRRAWRMQP